MLFPLRSILCFLLSTVVTSEITFTVEELSDKLPTSVSDMSVTYDETTDLMYLVGGCDDPQGNSQLFPDLYVCNSITDKVYSFDPKDNAFLELPPAPRERYRHSAANVKGNIWLVGGRTLEDMVIPEVDVYNPIEKSWSTIGVLPAELQVSDHGNFYYENYLYVVGGYEQEYMAKGTTFRIPTDTDELSTEIMPSLSDPRGDMHAVVSGKYGYVTGGFTHDDEGGGYCIPHSSTERYDLTTNDGWITIDDLSTGRADKALVVLDEHIFAIGGESKRPTMCSGETSEYTLVLDDIEVLVDPHLDVSDWKVVSNVRTMLFRFAGAAYPPTSSIYAFGGQQFYDPTCECFPTSDQVTKYHELVIDTPSSAGSIINKSRSVVAMVGVVLLAMFY